MEAIKSKLDSEKQKPKMRSEKEAAKKLDVTTFTKGDFVLKVDQNRKKKRCGGLKPTFQGSLVVDKVTKNGKINLKLKNGDVLKGTNKANSLKLYIERRY